jgi:hypothetical protein
MTVRRVIAAVTFLGLMYLFGGLVGLIVGVPIAAGSIFLRLPRSVFWGAAVAFMAAAPLALLAQGLPHRPVVGPSFGTDHLVAHVLVGLSLALAGWAGLNELIVEMDAAAEARRDARLGTSGAGSGDGDTGPDLPPDLYG